MVQIHDSSQRITIMNNKCKYCNKKTEISYITNNTENHKFKEIFVCDKCFSFFKNDCVKKYCICLSTINKKYDIYFYIFLFLCCIIFFGLLAHR